MGFMKPVVIIPGFAGSRLCIKRPSSNKSKVVRPKNDFINLNPFDKTWQGHFELDIDKHSSRADIIDDIHVHDFGGVDGIRNLCDDCQVIDNFIRKIDASKTIEKTYNYKYFDALISHLSSQYGYESRSDMFGAPYDFRKIGIVEYVEKYVDRLKDLLETSFDKNNGKRAVLLAHSIGGLVAYIILTEFISQSWKDRFIDRFISVSAPYGGCSIAMKTCLSGYPQLSFLKNKYLNVMSQSTGMTLAYPNVFGYRKSEILLAGMSANDGEFDVSNFHKALPEKMRHIWLDNTMDFIPSYVKNTGVPTTIITASLTSPTDHAYIYQDLSNTANQTPIITRYTKGDLLIPERSLTVHQRRASDFPNYNFMQVSGVEHTCILNDRRFHDIVTHYLRS